MNGPVTLSQRRLVLPVANNSNVSSVAARSRHSRDAKQQTGPVLSAEPGLMSQEGRRALRFVGRPDMLRDAKPDLFVVRMRCAAGDVRLPPGLGQNRRRKMPRG